MDASETTRRIFWRPGWRLIAFALNPVATIAPPRVIELALVLPRFAPRTTLDQAADLGVSKPRPILSVVSLQQHPGRRRNTQSRPSAGATGRAAFANQKVAADEKAERLGSVL